ncbi:MAG TPA: ATP-binding protein [Candidatus Tectomicrobia bacterium]|nr:ATP-binding protein [Candidatus Tectomicrobia bacterium]
MDGEPRRALPPDLARLLHDLRGPLNSVTMHLEVLKRSAMDDRAVDETLRVALQQIARLSEMVPAALEVVALEVQATAPVDLRALAVRAAARHAAVPVEGPWPRVVGDERLLDLALDHLLRNAVEASIAAGAARAPEVAAAIDGPTVVVTVRDWGIGLRTTNPKLLVRLMGTTKAGHRGLGLVTAERVARLHGGSLRFQAAPDGAAVSLVLPLR